MAETAFCWKKIPHWTFAAREEKSLLASKDKVTLLLGANVADDLKVKPGLADYSENPSALNSLLNLLCLSSIHGKPSPRDSTPDQNVGYLMFMPTVETYYGHTHTCDSF